MPEIQQPAELVNAIQQTLIRTLHQDTLLITPASQATQHSGSQQRLLIELLDCGPLVLHHDGRYAYDYQIRLQLQISDQLVDADMQALNLTARLQQIVAYNRWGLASDCLEWPQQITAELNNGSGYQGWRIAFRQTCYLGCRQIDDPLVVQLYATSHNIDDINSYERVNSKPDPQ